MAFGWKGVKESVEEVRAFLRKEAFLRLGVDLSSEETLPELSFGIGSLFPSLPRGCFSIIFAKCFCFCSQKLEACVFNSFGLFAPISPLLVCFELVEKALELYIGGSGAGRGWERSSDSADRIQRPRPPEAISWS